MKGFVVNVSVKTGLHCSRCSRPTPASISWDILTLPTKPVLISKASYGSLFFNFSIMHVSLSLRPHQLVFVLFVSCMELHDFYKMQGVILHKKIRSLVRPQCSCGFTSGAKAFEELLLLSRTLVLVWGRGLKQHMTVAGCHIRKRKTGFKICLLHFESHSTLTFVTMLLVCFFDTFIFL